MITITTKLDMRHGAVRPTIHLSQYDSDFTLIFELYSSDGTFTVENGTTALIRGTKSSGTGFSADASINISTKTVTVTGDAQMTASAGQNVYEITLYKGGKEINSANFLLLCERAALDADTITDESVLKELDAIIEGAETATQAAEEAEDAADRAEAAAQTLVIDPTLTKSGQAADAKDVGDKITDLKADLSKLKPGLSDNAKTALLACFRHVAWIDVDSETYYDALERALYEGEVVLERISATYTSSGQKIYPWNTLDDLRQYISVVATYSDGNSESVSNYTLSGSLETAQSTITVSYLNKTDQITVNVTIDSALIYYVQKGTVLDGSATSGFDTGVSLRDTDKSVSIIVDTTDEEILGRLRTVIFMSDRSPTTTNPNYQIFFNSAQTDDTYTKKYGVIACGSYAQYSSNVENSEHRLKVAIIREAGSNQPLIYMNVDGNVVFNFTPISASFVPDEQTVFIGRRPDGGYQYKGTINLCSFFSRALTVNEAKELLGVQ